MIVSPQRRTYLLAAAALSGTRSRVALVQPATRRHDRLAAVTGTVDGARA